MQTSKHGNTSKSCLFINSQGTSPIVAAGGIVVTPAPGFRWVENPYLNMPTYRRFIVGSTHVSRTINQSGKFAFGLKK